MTDLSSQSPVNRRDVLRLATAAGLSFALPPLDLRAAERRGPERKKSLLTIFLSGGPSQLETWDPHPGGAIGGRTTALRTKVANLSIAGFYPRLAERIDALSVIRSLVSREGDHERGTYFLKTGYRPDPTLTHPSLGAILAHEQPDEKVAIPQHVSLGGAPWPARGGFLGAKFDAFKVFDAGGNLENMRAPVDPGRQKTRLSNLDVVSKSFQQGRRLQSERTLHQHTIDAALRMMSSEQLRAFEIADERRDLAASYGGHVFGRGCLVARRLIERGVRAVEVTLNGFDTHANNHEGHETQAKILDPALATLLADLKERDLLDSTVVLVIGEFGRTPRINPLEGRDHWPHGFSCLVGGGGLRGGVVIGETDPAGEKKDPADPIPVQDLFATVLATLGVDFTKEMTTPISRPMALSDGKPIARLAIAR